MPNNAITSDITQQLDDAKAEDILVMQVDHLSNEFDKMIVCTATSQPHINALTHLISKFLKDNGYDIHLSKKSQSEWSVIDAGNIIIHIMVERARDFYQLENLWEYKK